MTSANSTDIEPNLTTAEASVTPSRKMALGDYVERLFVIAAGIFCGFILAYVIGFFTGWIPLC